MTCDAYVCLCLLYWRKSRLDPRSAGVAKHNYIHFVLVRSFFCQWCRFPAAAPAIISFDTNTNLCREKKMYSHTCSQLTHTDLKIYATLHSQQHRAILVGLDTNAPFFQHGSQVCGRVSGLVAKVGGPKMPPCLDPPAGLLLQIDDRSE